MALLGELLLALRLDDVELGGQVIHCGIARCGKECFHDFAAVRHHHADSAELYLEVLGQLLAAGLAGVHGDEVAYSRVELDQTHLAVGEDHLGDLGDLGRLYHLHLSCDHGQDLQLDAVELVEAAPDACDDQAFEDASCVIVALLRSTVSHHDLDA